MFLINYCTFLSQGCLKVLPFIIIFYAFAVNFFYFTNFQSSKLSLNFQCQSKKGKKFLAKKKFPLTFHIKLCKLVWKLILFALLCRLHVTKSFSSCIRFNFFAWIVSRRPIIICEILKILIILWPLALFFSWIRITKVLRRMNSNREVKMGRWKYFFKLNPKFFFLTVGNAKNSFTVAHEKKLHSLSQKLFQ